MKIEVRNLVKSYQNKLVLCIPELVIDSAGLIAIVGNNGAGKTTFLRLLLDLVQADEGFVFSNGNKVFRDESWKTYTGSYLDESFVIDFLTPQEFIKFVGATYEMTDEHIGASMQSFGAFFHDEDVWHPKKLIRDFSKGTVQKIGIAAALLSGPKVLILDEPFAHLDPTSQIWLKRSLINLNKDKGTTIIISSHNLNHVVEISSRIIVIEKGGIVKDIENSGGGKEVEQQLQSYFAV